MPVSLHPAVATSAAVILVMSYLYGGYWITSLNDEGEFDVPTVLDSLLHTEASVGQSDIGLSCNCSIYSDNDWKGKGV